MAAKIKRSVCFGSDSIAQERAELYLEAARARTDGNFSRMIIDIVDKELGVTLPRPQTGRPKNLIRQGDSDEHQAGRVPE